MKPVNRIISIILYVVTAIDIVIVIYDLATKGTVSTLQIVVTLACIAICLVDIYLIAKHKE